MGLRVADDESVAAIVTVGDAESDSESQFLVRPSILHMSDDGDTVLGGTPPPGHTHSVRGFASSVGDPAGVHVDDGDAYRGEDMVATALFCLIELTAEMVSGAVEVYATHPGDWSAARVAALRGSLDYLGLRAVVLVSEADLPSSLTAAGAASGLLLAHDAARAALAAVLSTPAGAAAPDPSPAENALDSTDVLPTLTAPPPTQAYSVALPETTVVPAAAVPATPPARSRRRGTYPVVAAAAVGVLLGGVAVAAVLNSRHPAPATPLPGARPSSAASASPQSIATELPAPATESAPPGAPSEAAAPDSTVAEPLPVTEEADPGDVTTTSTAPASTDAAGPPQSVPTTTNRLGQLPTWTYPLSPIPPIPPPPPLPSPHWQYP
ncbi:hypothetical protein EBN03_29065 [Nocardia stercoris]|uniref:Uncharacterized protein n=1 Tax=Nocardia stercoris TaxID=2483361 RepID=A0A3M2KVJ2_9NOCA|nr:hypothetical protein EBN03_29065 [Nocardia stercoris]